MSRCPHVGPTEEMHGKSQKENIIYRQEATWQAIPQLVAFHRQELSVLQRDIRKRCLWRGGLSVLASYVVQHHSAIQWPACTLQPYFSLSLVSINMCPD